MNQASLEYDGEVYYSELETTTWSGRPFSPVTQLIQELYEKFKDQSLLVLRNKISLNYPATAMCHGMTKIAAKSLRPVSTLVTKGILVSYSPPLMPVADFYATNFQNDYDAMNVCLKLASHISKSDQLYESDRQVAALLVSKEGDLLACSQNTNAKNRTQHAEVNLLQSYWARHHKPLPHGAKIYVNLQPCKMCSGMISYYSGAADIPVLFSQYDPGARRQSRAKINERHLP